MKNKLIIVRTSMSDDSDYSYIYDTAIQNTLDPYWAWAKENNINVNFTKNVDNDVSTWQLKLAVVAEFSNPTDLALFKLSFGNFPLKEINLQSMEKARFF